MVVKPFEPDSSIFDPGKLPDILSDNPVIMDNLHKKFSFRAQEFFGLVEKISDFKGIGQVDQGVAETGDDDTPTQDVTDEETLADDTSEPYEEPDEDSTLEDDSLDSEEMDSEWSDDDSDSLTPEELDRERM